ncbi:MAG: beta-galactosidase [Kiritimatiellaeota bacterium]|nr:beta-galactosidase [Kiritimatiellota bacterium]
MKTAIRPLLIASCVAWADVALSNPYGICAHIDWREWEVRDRELALMKEAGIGYVRTDFAWGGIQFDRESWNYGRLDAMMESAKGAAMPILPILDYHASFATPAHEHLDLWLRYVSNTVSRYQTQIPVWEVWNEQNLDQFWKSPNPTNYLALLTPTYELVKAINPELQVAIGGHAGVPLDFIEELYRLGAKPYFDIMNVHPYSHPAPPEAGLERTMRGLYAVMAKYGDEKKPTWVTETGWPTQPRRLMAPGMLRHAFSQLKKAPDAAWRTLVIHDPSLPVGSGIDLAIVADEIPGSVLAATFDEMLDAFEKNPPNAVILPVTESFPADERLIRYVRDGGVLVATAGASLCDETGMPLGNFALSEVLGVDCDGDIPGPSTLVLDEAHDELAEITGEFPQEYPVARLKNIGPRARVIGRYRLADGSMVPGVVTNVYGAGRSLYFAGRPEQKCHLYHYNEAQINAGHDWKDPRDPAHIRLVAGVVAAHTPQLWPSSFAKSAL